jgi:hypothetical protein
MVGEIMEYLAIAIILVVGFVLLKPNLTEKIKDWILSKLKK